MDGIHLEIKKEAEESEDVKLQSLSLESTIILEFPFHSILEMLNDLKQVTNSPYSRYDWK